MRRSKALLLLLLYWPAAALGLYEITVKSPELLGIRLPGWQAGVRAEETTAWHPHTGLGMIDHLWHESEEAVRFYAFLLERSERPEGLTTLHQASVAGP